MDSEQDIGFIRGVAYAAAMMKEYQLDSEKLLKEAAITKDDLMKYADEYDLQILGLVEKD